MPVMMRLPGIAPRRVDAPAALVDVLPTLLGALGMPANPQWQGRNLLASGQPGQDEQRPIFAQAFGSMLWLKLQSEMVLLDGRKLIVDEPRGVTKLYSLREEGKEKNNLAPEGSEAVQELATLLSSHRKANLSHPAYNAERNVAPLSDKTIQELRALGYVQ